MKWTRRGRKGAFRYFDAAGKQITDAAKIERSEQLAIPPAWRDVEISPSARAKLQATGYDKAGRKQYLYHPDYRAAPDQPRLVPRRRRALRARVTHVRDHDADAPARHGARQPRQPLVPRQA